MRCLSLLGHGFHAKEMAEKKDNTSKKHKAVSKGESKKRKERFCERGLGYSATRVVVVHPHSYTRCGGRSPHSSLASSRGLPHTIRCSSGKDLDDDVQLPKPDFLLQQASDKLADTEPLFHQDFSEEVCV